MVELVPIVKTSGQITYKGKNILDKSFRVEDLRTQVGMVFQKANPFPKSIYENIAYGQKSMVLKIKRYLMRSLKKACVAHLSGMN